MDLFTFTVFFLRLFPLNDDLKPSFRSTSDRFLRIFYFRAVREGTTRRRMILLYSELTSIRSSSRSFSSKKMGSGDSKLHFRKAVIQLTTKTQVSLCPDGR